MSTSLDQPLFDTFNRVNLKFVSGKGPWLLTENNERYLDFTSGIAVNAFGHAHPYLVNALKRQAEKLWHVSNVFEIEEQTRLAERLCANSFAEKVFFANSGAEAIECAIKTARRYHYCNQQPERVEIITLDGAFHGRTLATLAAGGQQKYLEGCGPKALGFTTVPFADLEALKSAITNKTAALLIEPIQGEGGVRIVPNKIMQAYRDICTQTEILLVLDEVQTGFGRTGKLFAHEWSGVTPDILCAAKGIGAGFPLSACLATRNAAHGMTAGIHGTTFGGNPLAMTVGNAVLDLILAPDFFSHVNKIAKQLKDGLEALVTRYFNVVSKVRGYGLLAGLQCVVPNKQVIDFARGEKLLTVAAGSNVVRILPPLNIEEADLANGLERLETALAKISKSQIGTH